MVFFQNEDSPRAGFRSTPSLGKLQISRWRAGDGYGIMGMAMALWGWFTSGFRGFCTWFANWLSPLVHPLWKKPLKRDSNHGAEALRMAGMIFRVFHQSRGCWFGQGSLASNWSPFFSGSNWLESGVVWFVLIYIPWFQWFHNLKLHRL